MHNRFWIVTCEHGGNQVPAAYAPLFSGYADTLDSHRGWDPGALEVAGLLAGHNDRVYSMGRHRYWAGVRV